MNKFCSIDEQDHALLQRAAEWPGSARLQQLDDGELRALTACHGVDFATAWLYRRIVSSSQYAPFVAEMEELLRDRPAHRRAVDATLAVVPGAFYREHPETGADGKCLRETAALLGYRTELIPTHSVGSSKLNAGRICDWLLDRVDRNIILCSLSKGAADVKVALARPDAQAAFRNVVAWINVGGTPAGSPMAAWLLDRPIPTLIYRLLLQCRGKDFGFIRELDRRPGSPLDRELQAPAHIKIIHVLGFPLRRHIRHRRTRRWHRRLSAFGPNDGATVLADNCQLPGVIFPVWGADHYLSSHWGPELLLTALLHYLRDKLKLAVPAPQPAPADSLAS